LTARIIRAAEERDGEQVRRPADRFASARSEGEADPGGDDGSGEAKDLSNGVEWVGQVAVGPRVDGGGSLGRGDGDYTPLVRRLRELGTVRTGP
jgi:hypothetical protein